LRTYCESDVIGPMTDLEMKAELARMLGAFADFCDAQGLRYCLSGGTLLGAVRHRGFIPWDDDIDVNMPRPDCERLMALSGGRIGGYELNPPNFDSEYHAYHWKLFDEGVLVRKSGGDRIYPAFIDIFPIEGLPSTRFGTACHYLRVRFWKSLAGCLWKPVWFHGSSPLACLCHAAFRPLALLWGPRRLFERVTGVMTSIPFDRSEFVGVMATKVHTTEERVRKADWLRTAEVDFEGRRFHGPGNASVYLTQLYGPDYMEPPPPAKRQAHGLAPARSVFGTEAGRNGRLRIAVCGLVKSENLGEQFIAQSLEMLIERECRALGFAGAISFAEVDLLGRSGRAEPVTGRYRNHLANYDGWSRWGVLGDVLVAGLRRLSRRTSCVRLQNLFHRLRHVAYRSCRNYAPRLRRYLAQQMCGCDYIVVDGAGLLEYCYNEYQEPLLLVSEHAESNGLEVVYNAIGRAGKYEESDFRSSILRRALRSPAVKYVSARDSVETVRACAGASHRVELLADAAFWLSEAFPVSASVARTKVGIGLIRGNSLTGYGFRFGADDWVRLFAGIARELRARGHEFEFFTNGLPGDEALGRKVLAALGLPDSSLVPRPTDAAELYATINGYRGIVTCRMHSAIAAFTLGVPSVVLSWNDKVEKLMAAVGLPERAVKVADFDPVRVIDRFERALDEGVDAAKVAAMREKAVRSVRGYVGRIVGKVAQEPDAS